ncbi:type I polyketide synthase [Chitinophaga sp. Ak27]|uniref:type I polyketide synthase n=1 Tax=Chitinophaga sp. Ak27 TaxID=2726116 RepID=UPI00145F1E7B|nr:type I polyketide synthase [Chitinophaga sp. Ak27]NLU93275.1 acyltransferase domain-containing protein [Chitinophaga sp. Ak27]
MAEVLHNGLEIAVVGMSCRMPGAEDVQSFWDNLVAKKESITFLDKATLRKMNVSPAQMNDPRYVNCAGGLLEGKEGFDADFFRIKPVEAMLMDPQIRIFLETAWHALEDAGYNPAGTDKITGIYAASKSGFYWQAKTFFSEEIQHLGGYAASTLANRDFMSMTAAYLLDLRGPGIMLSTSCSSSLVAIHLACQALNNGECNMALAGGVNILPLESKGYLHQEGMIYSADGHCRAFDKDASGTVEGEGAGVVVLKTLEDALKDRDHIYAIIKGSAVNNDGNRKLGFTAPGVHGQRQVITMCHQVAGVSPESIGYIEAHGTGTAIGDPIEVEALSLAFRTSRRNFCGIGSVKSNIGHLDAAAGVAGFIKTVLALYHKKIPPTVNFTTPNPKINFEESPFFVSEQVSNWKVTDHPRRAGVSSFGIGGTNAHLVLEEAPVTDQLPCTRKYNVVTLSAASEKALENSFTNLVVHATGNPGLPFQDLCYTLQTGRKELPYRMAFACADLSSIVSRPFVPVEKVSAEENRIVFMFTGQGNHYHRMGQGLYDTEEVFRVTADECFTILSEITGHDFKALLFEEVSGKTDITATAYAQPLLFVVEYAMALTLMQWGIQPDAMIGHSIGEYVAACLAGVFELRDCLKIVALRGGLMQSMQPGSMISVDLPASGINEFIGNDIDLAVINSGHSVVLSGSSSAIEACKSKLVAAKYQPIDLHTSHAFHSRMMEEMLPAFAAALATVKLHSPRIPFVSGLYGTWISADEACDPGYWVKQLRYTVQFAKGMDILMDSGYYTFIEIGPGNSLKRVVNSHPQKKENTRVYATLRHAVNTIGDHEFLLTNIADMWASGLPVKWSRFYKNTPCNRISLPGYPFEHVDFWLGDDIFDRHFNRRNQDAKAERDIADWFYAPVWKQTVVTKVIQPANTYAVFLPNEETYYDHIRTLCLDNTVFFVRPATAFRQDGENAWWINPDNEEDYLRLWRSLPVMPDKILYYWSQGMVNSDDTNNIRHGFFRPLIFVQSLINSGIGSNILISFITEGMFSVSGNETVSPFLSLLQGIVKVGPQEIVNLKLRIVDIDGATLAGNTANNLLPVLQQSTFQHHTIIFRNGRSWVQDWEAVKLPATDVAVIRRKGNYLVTGGTGKIGTRIAAWLMEEYEAHVVLLAGPHRRIDSSAVGNVERGSCVVKYGCLSDEQQMRDIIREAENERGPFSGVFHLAGITTAAPIERTTRESAFLHFDAKVTGTEVLYNIFKEKKPDFVLLASSLSAILGGLGYTAYAGANAYMDAFAGLALSKGDNWMSINFDGWHFDSTPGQQTIGPDEGIEVIVRALATSGFSQLAVSVTDLRKRMEQWITKAPGKEIKKAVSRTRPSLKQSFVAPYTPAEVQLAAMMNACFGYAEIGIDDNFFELGGDSLLAIAIIAKIHEQMGVRLSVQSFYEAPNIRNLAALVSGAAATVYRPLPKAEKRSHYALSAIQQRIFFASTLSADSTNYNLTSFYHIREKMPAGKLEEVFLSLVKRHEILRTSFVMIEREPRQVINDILHFTAEKYYSDEPAGNDILQQCSAQIKAFVRPFALNEPTLFRMGTIGFGDGTLLLMLDFHHIIADAVTINVLLNEMVALFSGSITAPVMLQYKDFSEWHNRLMQSELLAKEETYWLNRLGGNVPYLQLPADFPRAATHQYQADTCYFSIDEPLYREIKEISTANGTGVFIFMLAATLILLEKYTGEKDIVIGTETGGRPHADIQQTTGMFVGLLPLRHQVEPDITFKYFLNAVKENTLKDFDHQSFQFNELVRKLNKTRVDMNPLFNIIVSLDNISTTFSGSTETLKSSLDASMLEYRQRLSIWDMRFGIIDTGVGINIRLDYADCLYAAATVALMAERLKEVIKQVVADNTIQLKDIVLDTSTNNIARAATAREKIEFDF